MTTIDQLLNQREKTHGSFELHATVTQALKAVVIQNMADQGRELEPDMQEALDMVFHKVGRIVAGNPRHHDHWLDIAGYATLVADRLNGNGRNPF